MATQIKVLFESVRSALETAIIAEEKILIDSAVVKMEKEVEQIKRDRPNRLKEALKKRLQLLVANEVISADDAGTLDRLNNLGGYYYAPSKPYVDPCYSRNNEQQHNPRCYDSPPDPPPVEQRNNRC